MKKAKIAAIVAGLVVLIVSGVLFLVGYLKPKGAGIVIETTPSASVFIDGIQVGRTPYDEVRKPDEIIIKLVPDTFDNPLAPFETRVTLASGVKTVIRREFGESDNMSSGEIISFEKVGGDETSISIVSVPDVAQISIDGAIRGFAPFKTSSITPGEHQLILGSPGYKEKELLVRTYAGYKLTAVIKLSPLAEIPVVEPATEEVLAEEAEEAVIEIEILSTPTGFLRVREEPSTLGKEVGRVVPGESYRLIEQDEGTGWFKIEYEEEEEGWVSDEYAERVVEEQETTITPTASPSATPTGSPTP